MEAGVGVYLCISKVVDPLGKRLDCLDDSRE